MFKNYDQLFITLSFCCVVFVGAVAFDRMFWIDTVQSLKAENVYLTHSLEFERKARDLVISACNSK